MTLITERVPCASLEFWPGNPRRGDVAAIAESLKINGQYRPIVVQRSTNRIVAGNHTLQAAVSLGWDAIDAVLIDCDEATARRIVLADNKLSDMAGYDSEALAALLESVDSLEGTGYTADDLARLSPALPEGFQPLDPDAPVPAARTVTCPSCGCQFAP